MTTLNTTAIIDLTEARNTPAEEGFWTRAIYQLGEMFGRMWGYLNEDMGSVEGEDSEYIPTGGCCC